MQFLHLLGCVQKLLAASTTVCITRLFHSNCLSHIQSDPGAALRPHHQCGVCGRRLPHANGASVCHSQGRSGAIHKISCSSTHQVRHPLCCTLSPASQDTIGRSQHAGSHLACQSCVICPCKSHSSKAWISLLVYIGTGVAPTCKYIHLVGLTKPSNLTPQHARPLSEHDKMLVAMLCLASPVCSICTAICKAWSRCACACWWSPRGS